MIRRNSTNVSRLMSELCSFKCLKLYSLNFAIALAQIEIVILIKLAIIVLHKNTIIMINRLTQAQKSISNLSKGYFHLCLRMDFLQTLHFNNSLYTNYENVFIEFDS